MLCFYLSFLRCQKLTFKTAPVKTVICFLSHMLLLISNSKCPPEASPFCLTCYISYTKANVDFYIATTFSVDAISCKNHGTRCKWSDTYCNRSDKKKSITLLRHCHDGGWQWTSADLLQQQLINQQAETRNHVHFQGRSFHSRVFTLSFTRFSQLL